jgi:multidrug resistance efflux pump
MKLRAVFILIVLSFVVVGGYLVDRSRAAKESLLSGYFENLPTLLSSRLGGRVTHIYIKEGESVRKGQKLVQMEDTAYDRTVEAQLEQAREASQQLLETVRGPRIEDIQHQESVLREAEAEYQKLLNGPLPEEIGAARAKLLSAEEQYRKAVAGSRPEEIEAARAADRLAFAKLQESQNGPTAEERNQLAARLAEASSDEALAKKKLDRSQALYNEDAIAAQDLDIARSNFEQAQGRTRDAQQALKRAQEGTRPEEIRQAREGYRQAHAQLALLLAGTRREDIEAARQDMLAARQNLQLLLRGSRQEDIAAAKARVDQAQAMLLELKRGNRPEDIAKAEASHRSSLLQARSAQENLKERTIYAPFDATVDRVLVADGDLMAANAPVIQLSDPADIWIRVYLPEEQLAKVRIGDSAQIEVDGIPGQLPGRVQSIATKGEFTPANLQSPDERGQQVFAVRIGLAAPDPRIKAGMYATIRKVGMWP